MAKNRKMRRVVGLSLLIVLLAGCATSGREVSTGTQIVVLWHTFAGAEAEALQSLADHFNAGHRGKVVLITEYQSDIVEKLAATTPEHYPDLVAIWPEDLSSFMRLGLTVGKSQWGTSLQESLDDMLPMAESLYNFGGELKALPLGMATYLLYYNADWLGDLGYNTATAGWEDLRRAACAASDPMADQLGLGMPAQPGILLAFLAAGGANIYENGNYQFADQAGLQTASGLNEVLGGTCGYVDDNPGGSILRLGNNSMAMIVESSLHHRDIEQAVIEGRNFTMGISPLPAAYGAGNTLWYGPGVMLIAPEGARRDTALEALAWFFSPEAQQEWSLSTHYLSVRRSQLTMQLTLPTITPSEARLCEIALQAAERGTAIAWPPYTNMMACRASLLRALLSLGGQSTPGAYIEAAATACNTGMRSQP
ncbi:MAG: extracellular solute-binding protein [Anaerolineae bacterium]|nr:extracellular solute-binding protein [Anaerolineae bacterium]